MYSSSDRWEKVFCEMEKSRPLVDSIWSLVQDRVQRHRLLRMTLREDFLEQLVSHCTTHAREVAEQESRINIEAKRVELRDNQIRMQDEAFREILQHLASLDLGSGSDVTKTNQVTSNVLSACLSGVKRHVKLSKQLKEDRELLLKEVASKENEQNELRRQVRDLEGMISEMESRERTLSAHLLQTQDAHKKDVTKLITHIESLIQNNQKLVEENLRDRDAFRDVMQETQQKHDKQVSELIHTLTVMRGMSRSNSVSEDACALNTFDDAELDALRSQVLDQLPQK